MLGKKDEDEDPSAEAAGTEGATGACDGPVETVAAEAAKPPEPKAKRRPTGGGGAGYERNQKMLLGVGAAILVVVIVAALFALGYTIGKQKADIRQLAGGNAAQGLPGGGIGRGGQGPTGGAAGGQQNGQLREELKKMVESGEAVIIRGKVTSVEGGGVTVETPGGSQTVAVTDKTSYLGAGAKAGGGNTGVGPSVGDQVLVFARKSADGKLEAIAVRGGAAGQQNKQPAN